MRTVWAKFLLCVLVAGGAYAQDVFALPNSAVHAVTAPGITLESPFYDADGEAVTLPEEGRHLLWLIDAAFALETRENVPAAEFDPSADAAATLFNPTAELLDVLKADGEVLSGTVLFYERLTFLPGAAERAEASARFAPLTVLFDEDGVFPERVTDGAFASAPRLEGLYLMEGQTVRYRFLSPGLWERWGATDIVVDGASAFLAGAEPEVTSVPATVGAALPSDLRPVDGPLLILRLSGVDAEMDTAPDGDARAEMAMGLTENSTFLLENLPPLLERYGVQGVGLLLAGSPPVDALERAFPAWRFMSMDEPESWLAWLETQALLIDGAGEVQASFILFPARPDDPDRGALEQALRAVSER